MYHTYDLESYPNIFTYCGKFEGSDQYYIYEISERKNQIRELLEFLYWLRNNNVEMVGYNNVGFDYILIHELMTNPYTFDAAKAHQLTEKVINSQRFGYRVKNIRPSERYIPQIDIYKICHFDNRAKTTNLKALQFAMRSESLEDLPFEPGTVLTHEQMDQLVEYNKHDVDQTEKFFLKHTHLVDMRREFLNDGVLRGDVLNWNDVKIGVEYLVARLGRSICYKGSKPRQTFRELIQYNRIILPKINFRTKPYHDVLTWFYDQKIYVAKKGQVNPKLEANLAGLPVHFGIGGIHASASNKVFHTTETHQIIDIDVAGMYVAVAIANRFAPEHLGESFTHAYRQIKEDRARYAKGTSQNAALKLAGNGAYGNSNNMYSPLYDFQYTLSVTINGQLQLLQLIEMIDLIPDCELIQANTDGITVYINKENINFFNMWCSEWEKMTGLVLEEVLYSRMWIKDVNNYIAEEMNGKLKKKGAYWYPKNDKEHEGWWHKDLSNVASKKAAEICMTHNLEPEVAIKMITDPFDFMLRYKATGGASLFIGDTKQLKTVRYFVSTLGEQMYKLSKPKGEIGQFKRKAKISDDLFEKVTNEIGKGKHDERIHTKNKSTYQIVRTNIQSGWKVKQCNLASTFNWHELNWNYYIEETKKLIIGRE